MKSKRRNSDISEKAERLVQEEIGQLGRADQDLPAYRKSD
jgi:hypothetical protein